MIRPNATTNPSLPSYTKSKYHDGCQQYQGENKYLLLSSHEKFDSSSYCNFTRDNKFIVYRPTWRRIREFILFVLFTVRFIFKAYKFNSIEDSVSVISPSSVKAVHSAVLHYVVPDSFLFSSSYSVAMIFTFRTNVLT